MRVVACVVIACLVLAVQSVFVPKEHKFQTFPNVVDGESQKLNVGIFIQQDLIASDSDIARSYLNLAETLATQHRVTILHDKELSNTRFLSSAKSFGVSFVQIPLVTTQMEGTPEYIRQAYSIYEFLKTKTYDVLHFPDWEGKGYFVALSKMEGLDFQNTQIVIGLQQPYIWSKVNNFERIKDTEALGIDFMQRKSVEFADYVVSPSQFMLDWIEENQWVLDQDTAYVQPNLISHDTPVKFDSIDVVKVNELVFYGELNAREGLILFCDAIDLLNEKIGETQDDVKVTFLGNNADVQGIDAITYLDLRARRWSDKILTSIVTTENPQKAFNYLMQAENILAVIAPEQANSPIRVQQLMHAGIPFIASDVGGIPELIARESYLFEPRSDKLEAKLFEAMTSGFVLYSEDELSPYSSSANAERYLNFHQFITKVEPMPLNPSMTNQPLVSVCIVHHERPVLLMQAIASIEKQLYSNIEVILVDDNSKTPEALERLNSLQAVFDQRGWKIVRLQENVYLGKARNIAAKEANGKYILFMDDDNVAKEDEVSTFVQVFEHARSIDILTSVQDFFYGDDAPIDPSRAFAIRVPLGGDVATGFFWNCFGDANAMIKRSSFLEVGGFSEDYGVGYEDYEFFAKAVLQGLSLEVVPKSLFWYRRSYDSMSFSTNLFKNRMRYLRAYMEGADPEMSNLLLMSQSMHYESETPELRPHNNTCHLAASCGDCKAEYGCGFCISRNECMAGYNGTSNWNGTCKQHDGWIFNRTCINCTDHPTCENCTSDYNCGWCSSTGKCESGWAASPYNPYSKCGDKNHGNKNWYFEKKHCPGSKKSKIALIVGVSVAGAVLLMIAVAAGLYVFIQQKRKAREQRYMAINQAG